LDESRVKHGLKNRSKTGETNPDWFHQFSVNWPVNLKFFEIKYSKKTRADFNIFGQNRIKKFEVTHPTNFDEGEIKGKP
jgi:hypothetical protein